MEAPRTWREQTERYTLTGTRCNACGHVCFPRRTICPSCRHESVGELEDAEFEGTGELVTWTRVHDGAEGREVETPYLLGIVELDEGPRVTAQLVDLDPEDVQVGLRLESRFRKLGESSGSGVVHYGYKFGPVEDDA
jgi:uncharacterized OB-fold protein